MSAEHPPATHSAAADSTASAASQANHAHAPSHQSSESGTSDITCPYCSKALPSSLFAAAPAPAANGSASTSAVEDAKGADTTPRGKSEAGVGAETPTAAGNVTSESLRNSVDDADVAESTAAKSAITQDDIKRWAELAGVHAPTSTPKAVSVPARTQAPEVNSGKAIPLIAPPPPPGAKPSKAAGGRFNFFSRGKNSSVGGDDSDSDEDVATGYAQLGAPPSDDEDDGYESDKPFTPKTKSGPGGAAEEAHAGAQAGTEAKAVSESSAKTDEPAKDRARDSSTEYELRALLREVLGRVQSLTDSQATIMQSHDSLLTSLKIARSNLVMAEANTEMLEEELKRAKANASVAISRAGTPASQPRASAEGRTSSEAGHNRGTRPSSIHVPPPSVRTEKSEKSGGFGFWNGKKKLSSPIDMERPQVQRSLSTPRPGGDSVPQSPVVSTTSGAAEAALQAELKSLRDDAAASQAKLRKQADELEALKTGKKEIETELENLSQALFEEANKMVSEERRKRAEVEENLKEVREEREALRETVKVLGGKFATPDPSGAGTPDDQRSESGAAGGAGAGAGAGAGGLGVDELDKHYAALRRSIHHVVDGPTPGSVTPNGSANGVEVMDVERTDAEDTNEASQQADRKSEETADARNPLERTSAELYATGRDSPEIAEIRKEMEETGQSKLKYSVLNPPPAVKESLEVPPNPWA